MAQVTTLDDVLETFEFLDDWEDRYGYIIDLGKSVDTLPDALKLDDFLVRGCQSKVWLIPDVSEDGTLSFRADSDAVITRGLVSLILIIFNGKTAAEILAIDVQGILEQLGLKQHLSPLRANGLYSMVEKILTIADASK